MTYSTAAALPERAEVVIIGAGVVGASIAANLVERGVRDVVLLEADRAGSGSSAKPLGGFRAQFFDETNALLSQRSIDATFLRFEERYGVDIGVDRCGYLFLLTDEADVPAWEAAARLHASLGIESRMVGPAEIARLNPYVDSGAVPVAHYGPGAGTAYPERILEGFLRRATSDGCRLYEQAPVTAAEVVGDEAVLVTARGRVRAGAVIIAAGAWSRNVGELLGVSLPVTPVRRQMAFHRPGLAAPHRVPFTLDIATATYFHNLSDHTLAVGRSDPGQAPGFDRSFDESWVEGFRSAMRPLAPEIAELELQYGWAGLYEMSPDGHGLVGEFAGSAHRLLYAAGFSGHGVMHSPAVGEVVSDLYLGSTPFLDVSGLSVDRFRPDAVHLAPEGGVL